MQTLKGTIFDIDKKESAYYLKIAIDLGSINAMLYYGIMRFRGEGIEMNKEEGIKYIKKSADSGNKDSMIFYTCILINGDGIEKNKKEAKRYLKLVGEIDETYLDINVNTFIHSNKKDLFLPRMIQN